MGNSKLLFTEESLQEIPAEGRIEDNSKQDLNNQFTDNEANTTALPEIEKPNPTASMSFLPSSLIANTPEDKPFGDRLNQLNNIDQKDQQDTKQKVS